MSRRRSGRKRRHERGARLPGEARLHRCASHLLQRILSRVHQPEAECFRRKLAQVRSPRAIARRTRRFEGSFLENVLGPFATSISTKA